MDIRVQADIVKLRDTLLLLGAGAGVLAVSVRVTVRVAIDTVSDGAIDEVGDLVRNVRDGRSDAGEAELFRCARARLGGFFNVRVVCGVQGAEVGHERQRAVDHGLRASAVACACRPFQPQVGSLLVCVMSCRKGR